MSQERVTLEEIGSFVLMLCFLVVFVFFIIGVICACTGTYPGAIASRDEWAGKYFNSEIIWDGTEYLKVEKKKILTDGQSTIGRAE